MGGARRECLTLRQGMDFSASFLPNVQLRRILWPRTGPTCCELQSGTPSAGVADRYQLLPGDAFTVDLGVNFDCVLLTNFLHHFNKRECERILQRIYECLNPGGRLFILEFVPNPDRVTPPVPASFSLMMLGLTPEGTPTRCKNLRSCCSTPASLVTSFYKCRDLQQVIIGTK